MEPVLNTKQVQDLHTDPITPQKIGDIVTPPNNFSNRSNDISPSFGGIQSLNYIKGVKGWRLDYNGTHEFN